ncbi:MAG: B12-binding domain-containing radical SAM protein [Ignavibacteriales bacterium]
MPKPLKILLIIPPFSQINSPYPSAGQLSGFLRSKDYDVSSFDLSLASALRVFSKQGLATVFSRIAGREYDSEFIQRALSLSDQYINVIDPVIAFMQGKNPNLAYRIIQEGFLPQGESFASGSEDNKAFGYFSLQDKAKYYCSLFIDDITKIISRTIAPHFGLSRYAERIAQSPPYFDPVLQELSRPLNLIEEIIISETDAVIKKRTPDVVGFTVPFPGNLLGALIAARYIKTNNPGIKVVFGGGYINTELRKLEDKRIFDYTDYITYDDGELPLLNILYNLEGKGSCYVRTLMRVNNRLEYIDDAPLKNLPFDELSAPSLEGIVPEDYVPMTEMLNPMHRIWSDGYWNKLSVAHGCYWRKCTFCDITLDYIKRYSPAKASTVVNWMEEMMALSGKSAFHFTDEAAPPALLKELALEILRRKLIISWWGNIRFEKAFTRDLCRLLALSGCIAVSGGLEVADERLLQLINKGVTLSQVANVCHAFQQSGIMVHAYLMYGFPTESEQELINSLEMVRQFLKAGLFQSGFWHQFALTVHSPVAIDPGKFNIEILSSASNPFANNDLLHKDLNGIDYSRYSKGLNKALYNYMHGVGLNWDVTKWFQFRVPGSNLDKDLIQNCLTKAKEDSPVAERAQALWIAAPPVLEKHGNDRITLTVNSNAVIGSWTLENRIGRWIAHLAEASGINSKETSTFAGLRDTFPGGVSAFDDFTRTDTWHELREHVLLFV